MGHVARWQCYPDRTMRKTRTTPPPRLRLQLKHGVAIGPGKAALLEVIAKAGSISAAARSLGMSYKRAWMLVASMNEHFRGPVVEAVKGGRGHGGAVLTPLGTEVLERYRRMEQKALHAVAGEVAAFEKLLKRG